MNDKDVATRLRDMASYEGKREDRLVSVNRLDLLQLADEIDPPEEETLAHALNGTGSGVWSSSDDPCGRAARTGDVNTIRGIHIFGESVCINIGDKEMMFGFTGIHALSAYIKEHYE